MRISTARPSTPPLSAYLPTPPSTGGLGKRVRFTDLSSFKDYANAKTECSIKTTEGESVDEFFHKQQEGSDVELSNASDDNEEEHVSLNNIDGLPFPSSTTSSTRRTTLEKHDSFASLALAIDAPATVSTTFPFMKLPLSVRHQIYKHLLVVPALICVRQNHTSYHDEQKAFLYAERRELLPGIAYALAQCTVDGFQTRFSRFSSTNITILRVSKEVHAEAKPVLYGKNNFEIIRPANELCPPPDFSVRLFPPGCQRLVAKLNIRIRSFYDLQWLLSGGYNSIKNYYRGLATLTLILELESTSKGFGRQWARQDKEQWTAYVRRLQYALARELFGDRETGDGKVVPTWIDLRVLFSGEAYDEEYVGDSGEVCTVITEKEALEQGKRGDLRHALVEAWELFKKGGK